MTIVWGERAQRANRFFEASHDDGRVALESGARRCRLRAGAA